MDLRIEINRKLIHLGAGIAFVTLLYFNLLNWLLLAIFTFIIIVLFQISKGKKIFLTDWYLSTFEREEVRKNFPGKGMIFYLLGATLTIALFPKDIAIASIVILAIGDSVPNFVGRYFQNIPHPFSDKKFLEGALAGIIVSTLIALFFVKWHEALIASIIALLVEGIEMKFGMEKIDDNLFIPLVAGIVIVIVRKLLT